MKLFEERIPRKDGFALVEEGRGGRPSLEELGLGEMVILAEVGELATRLSIVRLGICKEERFSGFLGFSTVGAVSSIFLLLPSGLSAFGFNK
jgi:hypothetical protein